MAETTGTQPRITMYTTPHCGDCRAAKRVMKAHSIGYTEIDIADNEAARAEVQVINGGYSSVPTIVFESGRVLIEPSSPELERVLREEGVI